MMQEFLEWLLNSASGIQGNGNIQKIFTSCRQVCYYGELYNCYSDACFQKGCHQCYHSVVDDYRT